MLSQGDYDLSGKPRESDMSCYIYEIHDENCPDRPKGDGEKFKLITNIDTYECKTITEILACIRQDLKATYGAKK